MAKNLSVEIAAKVRTQFLVVKSIITVVTLQMTTSTFGRVEVPSLR